MTTGKSPATLSAEVVMLFMILLSCRRELTTIVRSEITVGPPGMSSAVQLPETPQLTLTVEELIYGRQIMGEVQGALAGDWVTVEMGRGEPGVGRCWNGVCSDIPGAEEIAGDTSQGVGVEFSATLVSETVSSEPFLFQAVVWNPVEWNAPAYKSPVLQLDARQLKWVSVAAGAQHTCLVSEEGYVACWGNSIFTSDETNNNPGRLDYETCSSGGNHTVCLLYGDQALAWGFDDWSQDADRPGPFLQVCAGGFHTCGLHDTGNVECWGMNDAGQSEDRFMTATAITCGYKHTCAVDQGGSPVCWGRAGDQTPRPEGVVFTSLTAGNQFTCGLTIEGGIDCWGDGQLGELEAPEGSFVALSAENSTACAIETTGDVRCWGSDLATQAPDRVLGPFTAIDVGGGHVCAIRSTGEVVCWGADNYSQSSGPSSRPW